MEPSQQPIGKYMSAAPVCVQLTAPLATVVDLMQQHDIRHMPVLDGERLVGVVSERDLAVVESLVPDDWERYPVAEAMTPKPHTVRFHTPVKDVARTMADHRHGCVLITDERGSLLGLFTTTDALRMLAGP